MTNHSVVAIILAAGASRRMGQPKQLLPYQDQTLLSYVIQCALASSCSSVIVVLGANANKIKPSIKKFPVEIIRNSEWSQGISSSIRCGVDYVRQQHFDCSNMNGMIFLVCDQPFVSTEIIEKLIGHYTELNKSIVACQYRTTVGIPVLFDYSFCAELEKLQGDYGAKKIIQKHCDRVATIKFSKGEVDLDTFADYQQFISESLQLRRTAL